MGPAANHSWAGAGQDLLELGDEQRPSLDAPIALGLGTVLFGPSSNELFFLAATGQVPTCFALELGCVSPDADFLSGLQTPLILHGIRG